MKTARLLLVVMLLTVVGCAEKDPLRPRAHPCGGSMSDGKFATSLNLGYPSTGGAHAIVDTTGAAFFIAAHYVVPPGFIAFGSPAAAFYFGDAAQLPTYDRMSGSISPAVTPIRVGVNEYKQVELPVGRYWLWVDSGGDVEVASCVANSVKGVAAPAREPGSTASPQIPGPATVLLELTDDGSHEGEFTNTGNIVIRATCERPSGKPQFPFVRQEVNGVADDADGGVGYVTCGMRNDMRPFSSQVGERTRISMHADGSKDWRVQVLTSSPQPVPEAEG